MTRLNTFTQEALLGRWVESLHIPLNGESPPTCNAIGARQRSDGAVQAHHHHGIV